MDRAPQEQPQANPVKIDIVTPMYGGTCFGHYMVSVIQLTKALDAEGIGWGYKFLPGASLIHHARNKLASEFLEGDATHLLFIDADIEFRAADVLKMIHADEDIIAGAYPIKGIDWEAVLLAARRGVTEDELPKAGSVFIGPRADVEFSVPVESAGTGLMLIKRRVFESLRDRVETYTEAFWKPGAGQLFDFFPTGAKDGQWIAEDVGFCRLARDAGFSIKVAPWTRTSHHGAYAYPG